MDYDSFLNHFIKNISQNQKQLHGFLGSELLDHLAIKKHKEICRKINSNEFNLNTKIYLGNHLKHVKLNYVSYRSKTLTY